MSIYTARRIGALLTLLAAIGYTCLCGPIDANNPCVAFTFWTTPALWVIGGTLLTARRDTKKKEQYLNNDIH